MKNFIVSFLVLWLTAAVGMAQVGINNDGGEPDSAAMLDVRSTSGGILPPRMTLAERDLIASPAPGLLIFNTDCNDLQFFNGSLWVPMSNKGVVPQPGPVSGNPGPCTGSAGVAYSVAPVAGATGYHWTVPPGSTILSGQGSNAIVAEVGSPGGDICVSALTGCARGEPSCLTVTPQQTLNAGITIAANSTTACQGSLVSFSAIAANGGSAPQFQWKKNNADIPGATGSTYSYMPVHNDMISCRMTSNNPCVPVSVVYSASLTMTVIPVKPVSVAITASSDTVCGGTVVTFVASAVNGGVSPQFQWRVNGSALAGATGPVYTYLPGHGDQVDCILTSNELCATGSPALSGVITISTSFNVGHQTSGGVAPENKTTTYSTVTNLQGEPSKCWITRNLGASQTATSAGDATEAASGWYWQFNRKKGYKHDGTTLAPAWSVTSVSEDSDWLPSEDPCNLELGTHWRLPTTTEWTNVDMAGSWANWNGPWNAGLKLSAGGYLNSGTGALSNRGTNGYYWGSTQKTLNSGMNLRINSSLSAMIVNNKAFGFTVRCLRDSCNNPPAVPAPGICNPSANQIIWNWGAVPGATGYRWNITNDYSTATDMGMATSKTESGLTCNTQYRRYVWSRNGCGHSLPVVLSQTTPACPLFSCGQELVVFHVPTGGVAPVNEYRTYGTAGNVAGAGHQCWITKNLGAAQQASAVNDTSGASAGWYWQFNRKQGYTLAGSTLQPAWSITSISESSNWLAANDPCNLELGPYWRLPTYTEWNNADNAGGWTDWNGPWNSPLKLHAAGYLQFSNGARMNQGSHGYYNSGTQNNADNGWNFFFYPGGSAMGFTGKANAFNVRCIRDSLNITPGCGHTFTVAHSAGSVAPVTKSVTYGTIDNIPGEPYKCWITKNLGATQQATASGDATEASAGWYWQFNKMQGYQYTTSRTPNSTWIPGIAENSNWTADNDPCSLLLGSAWRLPVTSEWINVDYAGSWTNSSGPWGSWLKIHAAGYLGSSSGTLSGRGANGNYWSISQYSHTTGWSLYFQSSYCYMNGTDSKSYGFSVRCLKDSCLAAPLQPAPGTLVPSVNQIVWDWWSVAGASGYRWNTTNDYGSAVDMGRATSREESGLAGATTYTRYVWAYNGCGVSSPLALSRTTPDCSGFSCGSNISVTHIAGQVAPVNKTTTYGTVTNIPGEPAKCWITKNLGATQQATAVNNTTEAPAGWYWQFNRKQGFKHDGTNRTPNTTWITEISETSNWLISNDPCNIELGSCWRLPTYAEWWNVDNAGGWTNWNGPWSSGLKLHAAGYLDNSNGSLYGRGSYGYYWGSTQYGSSGGWHLDFSSGYSSMSYDYKAYGFSVRCLRDY